MQLKYNYYMQEMEDQENIFVRDDEINDSQKESEEKIQQLTHELEDDFNQITEKVDVNTFKQEESGEVEKLKKQIEEDKDKFLRVIAEHQNKMKRLQIDAANIMNATISKLIEELTMIIDDLTNAHKISSNETKDGLDLIIKNMKKTLQKYGIEEIIPSIGDQFDSNLHQAVSVKESDLEEGKIVEIIKSGYKLKDKTITPAIVVTSA